MGKSADRRRSEFAVKSVLDVKSLEGSCCVEEEDDGKQQKAALHVERVLQDVISIPTLPNWRAVKDCPKKLCARLEAEYRVCTTRLVVAETSADRGTTKFLLELQDGHRVETVIIRYANNNKSKATTSGEDSESEDEPEEKESNNAKRERGAFQRATVCVSCQIGCAMACTFCATGTMGLTGSLTCGEILEQVYIADQFEKIFRLSGDSDAAMAKVSLLMRRDMVGEGIARVAREFAEELAEGLLTDYTKSAIAKQKGDETLLSRRYSSAIRNVVFMGMGEPLQNYEEVCRAVKVLMNRKMFGLAKHRVTVSTVGILSNMRKMKTDIPDVSLALSLHASNQKMRERLVPTAKNFDIADILQAGEEFVRSQWSSTDGRKKTQFLLIEYCLIGGVNDSPETARELADLIGARKDIFVINVIPYNPTDVSAQYRSPTALEQSEFIQALRAENVTVLVRKSMGQDISSACGQLVLDDRKKVTVTTNTANPWKEVMAAQTEGSKLRQRTKQHDTAEVANDDDAKTAPPVSSESIRIPSLSARDGLNEESPDSFAPPTPIFKDKEKIVTGAVIGAALAIAGIMLTRVLRNSRR